MLTESVTEVWKLYRDSHDELKEPMRMRFRKLDKYVDELERENVRLREEIEVTGLVAYVQGMKQLRAENAKLRDELAKWERLAAGIDLPEYPITEFQPKDLERENAKLRELVRIAIEYCVNGYCAEEDECPLYESRHSCRLHVEARELGIEVD